MRTADPQADLAVYRAKLQGRNRVLDASSEPCSCPEAAGQARGRAEDGDHPSRSSGCRRGPAHERRHPRPSCDARSALPVPRRGSPPLVGAVSFVGVAAVLGRSSARARTGSGSWRSWPRRRARRSPSADDGSISVSAVGALAGAALFGPRAALALAITTAAVEWSARRGPLHYVLFNIGTLSLASLAAASVFSAGFDGDLGRMVYVVAGIGAGASYFAVNMGLLSLAVAIEGHERWWAVFRERFAWLATHYLVYGFIGGVIWVGYDATGLWALAVFAVPLLLMRKTQEAYLRHTQRSAQKLRQAAETIQTQNVSLEHANKLPGSDRPPPQSLSATVDVRDAPPPPLTRQ